MTLLDSLVPGLGAVSSLAGLFSAQSAQRRAEEERRQALLQMQQQVDQQYQNSLEQNRQTLYGAAGQGGDAIRALGSRLGDSLAGAGVYDSSATAGALANAQGQQDASLAGLSQGLQNSALDRQQQGLMQVGGMRAADASGNIDYARQQAGGAAQGFGAYLGELAKMYGQTAQPAGGGGGPTDGSGGNGLPYQGTAQGDLNAIFNPNGGGYNPALGGAPSGAPYMNFDAAQSASQSGGGPTMPDQAQSDIPQVQVSGAAAPPAMPSAIPPAAGGPPLMPIPASPGASPYLSQGLGAAPMMGAPMPQPQSAQGNPWAFHPLAGFGGAAGPSLAQGSGVMNNAGAVNQNNLMRTGANMYRPMLPQINGTMNQGANLQGMPGWYAHRTNAMYGGR